MNGRIELPLVPIPPSLELPKLPGPIVRPLPPETIRRDRVELSPEARGSSAARDAVDVLVRDPETDAGKVSDRAVALARALAEPAAVSSAREEARRLAVDPERDARARAIAERFHSSFAAAIESDRGRVTKHSPTSS